ncbi:5-epimerase (Thymidine diphospho-4-keto-rhamnose 3, partial [Durusdinium trenchii]
MDLPIAEQYLTKSSRHVIRGMHFQVPPRDHAKLVSCPVGAVFDVVVDLRKGSPTYGRHASIELNDQKGNLLYIPTGFAHGFCVISPEALMLYNVTTIHSPAHDRGLHWNSCGIEWPTSTPIISQRDTEHPPLDSYDSGTGFIGSHLLRYLSNAGHELGVIVRAGSASASKDAFPHGTRICPYSGDVDSLVDALEAVRPDVVVHLASCYLAAHQPEQITDLVQSNVLFGSHLLEAIQKTDLCCRFLNTGTSWQHYGDADYEPVNLYAATKQAFESIIDYYVSAHEFRALSLKLFDTYGPADPRRKVFHWFEVAETSPTPIPFSPGEQMMDLVYIDDIVRGFERAIALLQATETPGHERYVLSSPDRMTLRDVAKTYEQAVGRPLNMEWGGRESPRRDSSASGHAFEQFEFGCRLKTGPSHYLQEPTPLTSPPSLRTASEDETIRESADANDGAARSAVLASALSIVSVAAKTLTTFFMVPLVVSAVGPTHCALWILVNTVTMYLSLSEAGIAQTIINFVGLTSLAVVAWTPAIHLIVPDATASDLETFRTAVTFTIPIAMARIPLLAFPATLTGLRHLPTRIVCEIISTMSAMLATVIVAYAGGSVVSLCVASNLVLLVTAAIPIVLLRRLHRWAIFALRDFNRSLLPQIGANSLLFFLISLSYLVDRTGANMLVSACGRLELVSGMYLLLTLFRTGGWSIVFLLSRSIQPHAILWANTNRTPHLLTTTVQVTRLTVLVAALIALGITGCAPAICELVLGTQLYPGDVTLIAIGLTFLIEATFLTTINILVALNHSRLLATFLTAKT